MPFLNVSGRMKTGRKIGKENIVKRRTTLKRLIPFGLLILMICILLVFSNDSLNLPDVLVSAVSRLTGNSAAGKENPGEFQTARLVRVVDGDTIVVDISGEEAKVRLIGIDTPESVASSKYLEQTGKENTREGEMAAEFVENLLAHTETVYLQKDVSETDRYGRLLRYVWLELPEDDADIREISEKMLNGILVWEGIAEPAAYAPDTAHREDFEYLADYRDTEFEETEEMQINGRETK